MNKTTILFAVFILVVAVVFVFNFSKTSPEVSPIVSGALAMKIIKSPTCGCCGNYASYAERKGFSVEVENVADIEAVKSEHGIPNNLMSCHTTIVGDYVVEGHIPVEVIEKLLTEKPNIKGIALAGMPSGSPGMPGGQIAPFEIHAIDINGADAGVYVEF